MKTPQKKTFSKKNKNKVIWLISLLFIVFAIMLTLGLPYLSNLNKKEKSTPTLSSFSEIALATYSPNSVERITIFPKGMQHYSFIAKDNHLFLEHGEAILAIDPLFESSLIKAVSEITVKEKVSDNLDNEQITAMGLDAPLSNIFVDYKDGSKISFTIGEVVPHLGYHYFISSIDSAVYYYNKGMAELFFKEKESFLPVENIPIDISLLSHLRIENKENPLEIAFTKNSTGQAMGELVFPFYYPVDSEITANILSALDQFFLGTYRGKITDENREQLGFNSPLATFYISQNAGASYNDDANGVFTEKNKQSEEIKLIIGKKQGEHYYTCAYNNSYYDINAYLFNSLLSLTPENCLSKNPFNMGETLFNRITFEMGNTILDFKFVHTEKVLSNNQLALDEKGNVILETTASLNGTNIPTKQLTAFLERLNEFTVTDLLPDSFIPSNSLPRWKLTLQTYTGKTRTIIAYSMDAFSDALVVEEIFQQYSDKEAISLVFSEWLQ